MNNWDIRSLAIVEADDFQDRYDRNGLNFLFYWKAKYPKFKITLFTIPEKTSPETIQLVMAHSDWIELAVHGWNHENVLECYSWDYDKAQTLLNRVERHIYSPDTEGIGIKVYEKIFKAPGWAITPGNSGYPAAPEDLINKDVQAVYKALRDKEYLVFDRHYNKHTRPEGSKIVCVDCNPDIVHMHTWNMTSPNENERNGFEQVEVRGVPWDTNTTFKFISEAWNEGLIIPCKE